MSKGPTKSQQVLAEAREWIEASKEEVAEREAELVRARVQLEMHETIYAVLEKTLSRSPRRTETKKPGKKSATKSKRASGMAQAIKNSIGRAQPIQPGCAFIVNNETGEMCMARDDDTIHDPSYLSSHLFVHPDQETQASGASGGD